MFFEIFKKLSQEQVTIIVATHDKNLAQIANKIYEGKRWKNQLILKTL